MNLIRVADDERLRDIKEKLRQWGYLSHHPEAERDVAWLLDQFEQLEAQIGRLEEKLKQYEWTLFLP